MKLLYQYNNWDYKTKIYSDWTKIRTGSWHADFPENIDIKITNYCDLWCPFCHEKSTIRWQHADLDYMYNLINKLPKWIEIAIGWWNPLSHPDLYKFVARLSGSGYIPNLTINSKHYNQLTQCIKDCIYWLWVSYWDWITFKPHKRTVIHTIAWVHTYTQIQQLLSSWHKVLILWYKDYGRWKVFHSNIVDKNIKDLYIHLPYMFWLCLLSFDNLALEQLNVKRLFTQHNRDWKYMWDEWTFTMYIDAVKKQYWIASSLPQRWELNNIILNFKHVLNESKKIMSVWN